MMIHASQNFLIAAIREALYQTERHQSTSAEATAIAAPGTSRATRMLLIREIETELSYAPAAAGSPWPGVLSVLRATQSDNSDTALVELPEFMIIDAVRWSLRPAAQHTELELATELSRIAAELSPFGQDAVGQLLRDFLAAVAQRNGPIMPWDEEAGWERTLRIFDAADQRVSISPEK